MHCKEARELMHAAIDGELGVSDAHALSAHIAECAQCRLHQQTVTLLRDRVRTHAEYHTAPPALTQHIQSALPKGDRIPSPPPRWDWRWLHAGAILACVVAVAWTVGVYLTLPSAHERLADDVVSAHVRSLLSNRTVDVASSDQHTVKPWFAGKLDFAPRVQDLTSEGFPLVGARVDYVDRRPVAALVYRRRQHMIDVFELPAPGSADAPPSRTSRNGYNAVHWKQGGTAFWAVSDVDSADLLKLQQILAAR